MKSRGRGNGIIVLPGNRISFTGEKMRGEGLNRLVSRMTRDKAAIQLRPSLGESEERADPAAMTSPSCPGGLRARRPLAGGRAGGRRQRWAPLAGAGSRRGSEPGPPLPVIMAPMGLGRKNKRNSIL